MQLRRKLAMAACATALTAPVLSSCGFNYATDEPYTPAAGTNNHEGEVDVLSAVVVAAQSDSGTLLAGLSNSNDDEARTLTGISGDGITVDLEPVEVPPGGFVNLRDVDAHVSGTFEEGNVLQLTAEFDSGESLELDVPVVTSCDEYEGLDTSAETSGESEDPRYSCEYAESESEH